MHKTQSDKVQECVIHKVAGFRIVQHAESQGSGVQNMQSGWVQFIIHRVVGFRSA